MIGLINAVLVTAGIYFIISLIFKFSSSKECEHKWVRYTIQKSLNSPRQKCVICEHCGKSYIKEVGLETIEEGFFCSNVIDVDDLWRTAKDPYIGSIDHILSKNGFDPLIDEEVNPELKTSK